MRFRRYLNREQINNEIVHLVYSTENLNFRFDKSLNYKQQEQKYHKRGPHQTST